MDTLDLKGMTCPVPVVETKKYLEKNPVDTIEVLLDNDVSAGNVTRFLTSRGFSVASEIKENGALYVLKGTRTGGIETQPGAAATSPAVDKKLLVVIDSDTIGRGDDELGRVLMKAFLHTLKDLDILPWRIVFLNGGVKLVAEGSEFVGPLSEIAGLGTELLACGTCLDFFHLKEKLATGRISNMHEIASSFLDATNVLKP
jgi:selenium metabolism protein YedF